MGKLRGCINVIHVRNEKNRPKYDWFWYPCIFMSCVFCVSDKFMFMNIEIRSLRLAIPFEIISSISNVAYFTESRFWKLYCPSNREFIGKMVIQAIKYHSFKNLSHYSDVVMGVMASQITSLTIVYLNINSGASQRKHQSSAPLAFVRGIHRGPVNSPHKWPVTPKMFPFDDAIMILLINKAVGR